MCGYMSVYWLWVGKSVACKSLKIEMNMEKETHPNLPRINIFRYLKILINKCEKSYIHLRL